MLGIEPRVLYSATELLPSPVLRVILHLVICGLDLVIRMLLKLMAGLAHPGHWCLTASNLALGLLNTKQALAVQYTINWAYGTVTLLRAINCPEEASQSSSVSGTFKPMVERGTLGAARLH